MTIHLKIVKETKQFWKEITDQKEHYGNAE